MANLTPAAHAAASLSVARTHTDVDQQIDTIRDVSGVIGSVSGNCIVFNLHFAIIKDDISVDDLVRRINYALKNSNHE